MRNRVGQLIYFIPIAFCLMILPSCFDYNPNQIMLEDDEKDLNFKNLTKLTANPASETIRFALMGDTQRFYDEAAEFVENVNTRDDIDFVVHAGDISDFGLAKEFKWVRDIMKEIRVPYFTVVGNHDLLANGKKVYLEMFGDFNFSFEYGDYKFIMLDTNSREYGFNGRVPDLEWLQSQLDDNIEDKRVIVISHIPPFDADFDSNLEAEYAKILSDDPNASLSLHGHRHSFDDQEYYNDGVRYFVTTTVQKQGYAVVTLSPAGADIEIVNF